MKFAVHTDKGVFHVDAKTAHDAREIVRKKHDARISKVKVVGNQPRSAGAGMIARDTTLPSLLARSQRAHLDPDDELPPWLGQRMRETTHAIHRAAHEAALDSKDPHHD